MLGTVLPERRMTMLNSKRSLLAVLAGGMVLPQIGGCLPSLDTLPTWIDIGSQFLQGWVAAIELNFLA